MRGPFSRMRGAPRLGNGPGVHRFVWDLTVEGPPNSFRGGPMVVPGTYQARLTVDDAVHTRDFEAMMDPRVVADGVTVADLRAQFELGMEILAAIQDAQGTIERLEQAMDMAADGGDVEDELREIERALVTDRSISSYPRPMLADQLGYLYGNATAADQKPGEDMYERLADLKAELEEHKSRLQRLMRTITEEGTRR